MSNGVGMGEEENLESRIEALELEMKRLLALERRINESETRIGQLYSQISTFETIQQEVLEKVNELSTMVFEVEIENLENRVSLLEKENGNYV